jgi:hypothetical protein
VTSSDANIQWGRGTLFIEGYNIKRGEKADVVNQHLLQI